MEAIFWGHMSVVCLTAALRQWERGKEPWDNRLESQGAPPLTPPGAPNPVGWGPRGGRGRSRAGRRATSLLNSRHRRLGVVPWAKQQDPLIGFLIIFLHLAIKDTTCVGWSSPLFSSGASVTCPLLRADGAEVGGWGESQDWEV